MAACNEFGYRLSDVTIESWHVHLVLFHNEDKIETVMGRLKTRMRTALTRGRIWTEGYCAEPLFDEAAIMQVQEYVARHLGCRMSDGRFEWQRRERVTEGDNIVIRYLKSAYAPSLRRTIARPWPAILGSAVLFAVALLLFSRLGGEFIPTLDEKNVLLPGAANTEHLARSGPAHAVGCREGGQSSFHRSPFGCSRNS